MIDMNTRFAIKTLGCKVNQYEAQVLRENLLRIGFSESVPEKADVFILNSCTVTGQADIKTRRLIRKIKKENPRVKIFVTGCYAVYDEDVKSLESMDEVYGVVRNREKGTIPGRLDTSFGEGLAGPGLKEEVSGFSSHTRAFLKMQDGCDQDCSYCKVNIVRGSSRSREEKEILAELKRLYAGGYKEIVMTGICLGAWEGENGRALADLLEGADRIEGDFRIRLSSIEPNHISDKLVDVIAGSRRICRHLHIPLQSGSDRILAEMRRRYDTAAFRGIIERIRDKLPDAGVTIDVIAGFPGEEDSDFLSTERFIGEIRPSRLHVFKYSDRKGTKAFGMRGKVDPAEAKDRVKRLIGAGEVLQREFCLRFVGKQVEVLIEEDDNGAFSGYTGEYVSAEVKGIPGKKGDLVTVKAEGIDDSEPVLVAGRG